MLSGLDWATRIGKVNLRLHWRQGLSVAIGAALAAGAWSLAFPDGLPFLRIWAGLATGGLLGFAAGTIWQLRDPLRRSRTSGKLVLQASGALGVLSAVSFIVMAPMMLGQRTQRSLLRSLEAARITEARVGARDRDGSRIVDREKLDRFVALARKAEIFHPDHEGTLMSFRLLLVRRDDAPLDYEGRVPSKHPDDIALQFRAGLILSEMLLPGGRAWVEESLR